MKNFLLKLYRAWMKFSYYLGMINSVVIFLLTYFFIIGFYAILLRLIRLFKKKALPIWKVKSNEFVNLETAKYQF